MNVSTGEFLALALCAPVVSFLLSILMVRLMPRGRMRYYLNRWPVLSLLLPITLSIVAFRMLEGGLGKLSKGFVNVYWQLAGGRRLYRYGQYGYGSRSRAR